MTDSLLPCVEHELGAPVRASVIWLHGLGANGHDFEPILPLLGVDQLGIRFVFPHAPEIPVTLNGGFVMPAWYDILGMELDSSQDEVGIRRSSEQVTRLIEREVERGVPEERIVLAGFSQGGAIALHLGLRYPKKLAAVIALSTYLVRADKLESECSEANRNTSVFAAHGTQDPMVVYPRGVHARDTLQALGYDVEWKEYPMQHQVCEPEIDAIGAYLRRVLEA